MSGLADLGLLAAAPWLAALAVVIAPARAGRALAVAGALAVVVVLVACLAGAPAIAGPWLGRGVQLSLALDPLAGLGLVVAAIAGLLAVIEEERPTRARLAELLALQGSVMLALLAQDAMVLAGAWALTPALVLALVATAGGAAARVVGRVLALYLALGTAALLIAAAGLAVAQRAAADGVWSAAIADIAKVRTPIMMALPIAAGLALAGVLALGLWPLHAGMSLGTGSASGGAGRLLAGPVRWLGLDALIRLWAPLAPLGAAALAPGLAGLAVAGAVYAGLCARIEPDPKRRAAGILLVAWSVAVLGVATLAHEGLCGALILGVVGALGQAGLARGGTATRVAIGLAGATGGVLVVIAALRFSDLTLAGLAPWSACGAALALGLAGSAMVGRTCLIGNVQEDRSDRTWSIRHVIGRAIVTAALLGLVARPKALLGWVGTASAGWVEAIALQRCLALHDPQPAPEPLPGSRPLRCDSPLAGLRSGQALERERSGGGD